jgi:hypothetical protein
MKLITKENWVYWFIGIYFGWFFGWMIYNLVTDSEPRIWAVVAFVATPIVARIVADKFGWIKTEL